MREQAGIIIGFFSHTKVHRCIMPRTKSFLLQAGVGGNANSKVTVAVSSLQDTTAPQAPTVGAVIFEVDRRPSGASLKQPVPATTGFTETSDGTLTVPTKGLHPFTPYLLFL
jgi:hypothetical protein